MNSLNVHDFGARGDGMTDDSRAIQAAVDTAGGKRRQYPPFAIAPSITNLTQAEAWDRLSLFENRDILAHKFNARHGRKLSAGKAAEILANLSQGREYADAAARAAEVVRPLLQYYAVLGLARAVILFKDPIAREGSLSQSHGLVTSGWAAALDSTTGLSQLTVKTCPGTFLELARVTGMVERFPFFYPPIPTQVAWEQVRPGITDTVTIKVIDLIARSPDMASLFAEVTGSSPACREVFPFILSGDTQSDIDILPGPFGLPPVTELRGLLRIADDLDIATRSRHNFRATNDYYSIRYRHSTYEDAAHLHPPMAADEQGNVYAIFYMSEQPPLTQLLTLVALSYSLGMLARYFPTTWQALLYRQKGDYLYPLFRQVMRLVQSRIPKMMLDELEAGPTTTDSAA